MENELVEQRKQKIKELRSIGINPFLNDFKPSHDAGGVLSSYSNFSDEEIKNLSDEFSLAGRIIALRDFGKCSFFHIMDRTGKIQGYIRRDVIGDEKLNFFKKFIDIGDFIGIRGDLFKTKTGEITINVKDFKLITKSLYPLPEKWHGLKDVETRYRQRYLDLISNPEVKEIFLKRTEIIKLIRGFLNERVSTQHNPEFTIMELYQSYATYEDLMDLIEELICFVTETLLGALEFGYQDMKVNMKRPWRRINLIKSVKSKLGEEILSSDEFLFKKASSLGIAHKGIRGKAIVEIFERTIGDEIVDPTFVYGFPVDVSPLARKNDLNPEITDRFELYIAGREVVNAFSELNDPDDQKERFLKQHYFKSKGEEVHEMDEDFIGALEHGMPPTAGAGIGVDRLVMLLTNSPSIREVIFFPHLRPE